MMTSIHVTVTGPGECIHNEMLIIEKALKDAGYPVTVINSHPPANKTITDAPKGWKIILTAEHQPWGG
ncbi:MAG: hypothetical protein EBU90_14060 [Proteobacteria bacterium]|nr:hypothetical protein [Pseudomonadota bacterium]